VPEVSFADGDVIFREGDKAGPVYMVERGMVRIARSSERGETILGEVGERGIFGEMSLIDSAPRMATATAIGPTLCSVTPVAQMQRKLALLGPDLVAFYGQMIAYIRNTLPYEDREATHETAADDAAMVLLERLPGVIALLQHPPPVIVSLLELFATYIERRLPPAMLARRQVTGAV
jgi:CRP-like cAMP-binding protein